MFTLVSPPRLLAHATLLLSASATLLAQDPPRPPDSDSPARARPNILWISCEDISPHLGCYGDAYAVTPHLDRLATQGVCYDQAFATIGVCAPARSTIITGMYPTSLGSQHMRCTGRLPRGVEMFPALLRRAGYYCTNRSKQDYNLKTAADVWDVSGGKAHYRNRRPGQPFFAVFNLTVCHESKIRQPQKRYDRSTRDFSPKERHDPAAAPVPPYHPDTPEVRRDWARYADMITLMDRQAGKLLAELDAAGLADDTIVMFWSDHGAGMPRSKRWLYDSSLRVPLILRVPERFRNLAPASHRPGARSEDLVSFVDFAPTVLSLAGVTLPSKMQGQAFLGAHRPPPRKFVYGFRDRMDERYDMLRALRSRRFHYIRNFMPHRVYAQHIDYMFQMPTMRVWQARHRQGKLKPVQNRFFETKPIEELYDAEADPHQVRNLAADPNHRDTLRAMRGALARWMQTERDLGLLPEADLRTRFGDQAPFDAVRGGTKLSWADLLAAADRVGRGPDSLPGVRRDLDADDPARRYWGAEACVAMGPACAPVQKRLQALLEDPAPDVAITAAEALCALGDEARALPVLVKHLRGGPPWAQLRAVGVLDRLDARAKPVRSALEGAADAGNSYVVRVARKALRDLR